MCYFWPLRSLPLCVSAGSGTGGRVTTSFGSTNVAFISGVAIQIDGKIVVAVPTGDAVRNFAVARYLAQ